MQIPSRNIDAVLDVLRTAAAERATYALNAALLKWQHEETELPGLITQSSLEGVLGMARSAVEALEVLYEMAGEVIDTRDDDDDDKEPDPVSRAAGEHKCLILRSIYRIPT